MALKKISDLLEDCDYSCSDEQIGRICRLLRQRDAEILSEIDIIFKSDHRAGCGGFVSEEVIAKIRHLLTPIDSGPEWFKSMFSKGFTGPEMWSEIAKHMKTKRHAE